MPYYFNINLNFNNPFELCQLVEFESHAWYRLYASIRMKNILCLADAPFPCEMMLMHAGQNISYITPLAPFLARLFPNVRVIQSDMSDIMLKYPTPHIQEKFTQAWQTSPMNHTYQKIDTCHLNRTFLAKTTESLPWEGWDLIICRKGMCDCFGDATDRLCAGIVKSVFAMQNFLTKISYGLNDTVHALAILHGHGTQEIVHQWNHVVQTWNQMNQNHYKKQTVQLIVQNNKVKFTNFFILIRKKDQNEQ